MMHERRRGKRALSDHLLSLYFPYTINFSPLTKFLNSNDMKLLFLIDVLLCKAYYIIPKEKYLLAFLFISMAGAWLNETALTIWIRLMILVC